MTRQKIQTELKSAFLALAFCQNEYQTRLVNQEIEELKKKLEEVA